MDQKPNQQRKTSRLPTQTGDISFVPPQCIDTEESILGSCLENQFVVEFVVRRCKAEMFFKEEHQIIFEAIKNLFYEGSAIDILIMTDYLKKKHQLESIGGIFYLTTLSSNTHHSSNIEFHVAILWQHYLRRKIFALGLEYTKHSVNDSHDPLDLLASLFAEIEDIQQLIQAHKTITIANVVDKTFDDIFKRATGEVTSFYKSGYDKLDEIVRFSHSKIMLLGGAAKHMKTRFMISIICGLLKNYPDEIAVDWYCLEDGTEALLKVILSHLCYMDVDEIDSVKEIIDVQKLDLLERMSKVIRTWDVEYREERTSINHISADFVAFAKKRPGKLPILIIDNALLVDNKEDDRDDRIMNKLVDVRSATKGLIIVVHHFNSDQQKKENIKMAYRPSLNDLKGREAYRRVPNVVMLINKPGMYSDLVSEFVGMNDIFEHLFIVDVAANRAGKASEDDKTLLRYWTIPEYSYFEEIKI
jgi:replicative DNA helicase